MRKPNTSLVMVTRDPSEEWKPALRVLSEARHRGFEVVVAVDSRSSDEDKSLVKQVAHRFVDFKNEDCWPESGLNVALDAGSRDWAFIVSDDEEPSERLWQFASVEPKLKDPKGRHYLWRCRMIAPLPDWSAHYTTLDTHQPRYFPRESIRWPGGFDELPVSPLTEVDFNLVLWHYTLWSPRAYREQKVKDHEAAWNASWDKHEWPFPGRASYLYEDHPEAYASLAQWEGQRPK